MKVCNLIRTGMLLLTAVCVSHAAEELPPGVPNPVGPDGKYTSAIMFTTPAYRNEAFKLVLQEANQVAKELRLPEKLPIEASDVQDVFISPFGFARVEKKIGNLATANYSYAVSIDNKFSYLERTHLEQECLNYQKRYVWPVSRVETNEPFQLATQWLTAASMDVKALSRDLHLIIKPDDEFIRLPKGVFAPVYYVAWCKKWVPIPGVQFTDTREWEPVALVRMFVPSKTLLQMRVEDSKYILREPLVVTNLAVLLSQTNVFVSAKSSARQAERQETTSESPAKLARQISNADRIVCTNFFGLEGEPKVNLTVSGERAKRIVKAVSSATRLEDRTNSMWDLQLRFYAGTNLLDEIRFQRNVFLAQNEEFSDQTGELEKLYSEAFNPVLPEKGEAPSRP